MSEPSRRRLVVLVAVIVLFVGLLATAIWLLSTRTYVIVPGADMHREASALCDSVIDALPENASVGSSLRGGFDAGSVIGFTGVIREEDQDALLARLRARRTETPFRYPVFVTFHDRLESASRNIEGGRITRQWKVGLLREERLE